LHSFQGNCPPRGSLSQDYQPFIGGFDTSNPKDLLMLSLFFEKVIANG